MKKTTKILIAVTFWLVLTVYVYTNMLEWLFNWFMTGSLYISISIVAVVFIFLVAATIMLFTGKGIFKQDKV